jgi:hypothetical protein
MSLAEVIETLDDPERKVARETHKALLNRMDVKERNTPTTLYNRKIRSYNAKLWEKIRAEIKNTFAQKAAFSEGMRQTRPLKYRAAKTATPILNRLYASRQRLAGEGAKGLVSLSQRKGAKSPEQWVRDVTRIESVKVRAQVACLVWWDFFAQRDRSNGQRYWDHLDEFMDEYVDGVPAKDIAYGLMRIGYHPYDAAARSIGGDIRS